MPGLERLGRYEVIAEIGQGEMGTVYKAIDPRLDRVVALKVVRIDPGDLESREFRQRFHAEARSAGRLSHPNIVIIYDFGEVEDRAYIAMEFLRGETLRSMLDRQRFSTRRAVRYAGQIAEGLAAAHAEGVVHRDIKPANVVRLPNGLLKITDFGIARLPASLLTLDGTLLGTPKYMSPEQVKSLRVDGRSDIFSLGVVLYEMLTATLPFGGRSIGEVMHQIAHDKPIHPQRWNPAIPEAVVRILAKCLAKDPEERYQGMADLARDLRIHKVMDVARDAAVNDVFLPVDPGAQLPRPESPRVAAASAANDPRSPPGGFDQTVPMEVASGASAGLGFDAGPARLRWSPRSMAVTGLALVVVLIVGSIVFHRRATLGDANAITTSPAPAAPVTTATLPPPAAPSVDKAAPVEASDATTAPEPDAAPKPVRRARPKPVVAPPPVADAVPPKLEPLSAPVEAPKPLPDDPMLKKAAADAQLKAELKRQHDCLTFNRCD